MKISPKMIAACKAAGACSEGLAWISAKPRTVEQLYEHNLQWFFWLKNILSNPARDTYHAAVKPAREAYSYSTAAEKIAIDEYNATVKPVLIAALRKDGY